MIKLVTLSAMAVQPLGALNPPLTTQNLKWSDKVSRAALACFETLKTILTFPLRYLGSKTWSIPGIILRTPWLLFKRIFYTSPLSFKEELLGIHYHYFFEKELSPEELKPYLPYAAPIRFVSAMKQEDLMPGWKHISSSEIDLGEGAPQAKEGYFEDRVAGFKAAIQEKGDQVIVSFDALALIPGMTKGEPRWKRLWNYFRAFMKDEPVGVRNVVGSFVGLHPSNYDLADAFVEKLRRHPRFKNKTFVLSGLCYGGAIASYVGIKRGIRTVSLNSFPLSVGSQYALGDDRLSLAHRYVTHISTKKDFLTDGRSYPYLDLIASRMGFRTPGHFGHRFLIPSIYQTQGKNHAEPWNAVVKHLGFHQDTLPKDLV